MNSKVLHELRKFISDSKVDMFASISADRTRYLTVVMENVAKTHNASAVIRTCDCFGIQDLHLLQREAVYESVRDISLGAAQWIDIHSQSNQEESTPDYLKRLKSKGYKIICTTPHTEISIEDVDIDQPMAVVFGTERQGLSQETLEAADELVRLPMYGFTESYNVSVSVAMSVFSLRSRLEKEQFNWKLSEEEQVDIQIKWCELIINNGSKVREEIERRLIEKE